MRKTMLLIAALVMFASAQAANDYVFINDTGKSKIYIVNNRFSFTDHAIKAWILNDFAKPDTGGPGKPYSSLLYQAEFNCTDRTKTLLYVAAYSARMAKGAPNHTFDTVKQNMESTHNIIPGSTDDELIEILCKKFTK